jgi:hypothetical protein
MKIASVSHLRQRGRDHAAVEEFHEERARDDRCDQPLTIFGGEETFDGSEEHDPGYFSLNALLPRLRRMDA